MYYSGGMRKRLELATVLFPGVRLYILDEPTSGLDPEGRQVFSELIEEEHKKGATVFMITHLEDEVQYADRIGIIDRGKIIAEGSPKQLKEKARLKDVVFLEIADRPEAAEKILKNKYEENFVVREGNKFRIQSESLENIASALTKLLAENGIRIKKSKS